MALGRGGAAEQQFAPADRRQVLGVAHGAAAQQVDGPRGEVRRGAGPLRVAGQRRVQGVHGVRAGQARRVGRPAGQTQGLVDLLAGRRPSGEQVDEPLEQQRGDALRPVGGRHLDGVGGRPGGQDGPGVDVVAERRPDPGAQPDGGAADAGRVGAPRVEQFEEDLVALAQRAGRGQHGGQCQQHLAAPGVVRQAPQGEPQPADGGRRIGAEHLVRGAVEQRRLLRQRLGGEALDVPGHLVVGGAEGRAGRGGPAVRLRPGAGREVLVHRALEQGVTEDQVG